MFFVTLEGVIKLDSREENTKWNVGMDWIAAKESGNEKIGENKEGQAYKTQISTEVVENQQLLAYVAIHSSTIGYLEFSPERFQRAHGIHL